MARIRAPLCLAVTAIAALTLGAGVASAHTARVASQHTLSFTPDVASDVFFGQLSSAMGACERGRSATLFRVVGGSATPDANLGTATTNTNGLWSKGIGDADAGKYYGVAAKKVIKRSGHKHVCKSSQSNKVTVPDCSDAGSDDSSAGAQVLSPISGNDGGGTVDGTICAGDQDWFKVSVVDGFAAQTEVRFTLTPGSASQGKGGNLDLHVYEPATTLRASSTNAGTAEEVVLYECPDAPGTTDDSCTVYAKVIGADATATNAYTLTADGNP
jgi:hypothetical protein